jgi:hypothetical protein
MRQAEVFALVGELPSARRACHLLSELLDLFDCFGVHLCQRYLMPSPRAGELAEFLTPKQVGVVRCESTRRMGGNLDDPLLHCRIQTKLRQHGNDEGEIVRMGEPGKYQVRFDDGFAFPTPLLI